MIFESNVEVKKINDVDMDLLIPLKTDQFIPVKVLRGYNITAENIEILGTVNGVDLREMQEKTFMVSSNYIIINLLNKEILVERQYFLTLFESMFRKLSFQKLLF